MINHTTTPKPTRPEQPADEGLDGVACSPSDSDTPETDAAMLSMQQSYDCGELFEGIHDLIMKMEKLERERNAYKAGFDMDGNNAAEACCGQFKQKLKARIESLESAIKNLRDVKGHHNTQLATERLFDLLENA